MTFKKNDDSNCHAYHHVFWKKEIVNDSDSKQFICLSFLEKRQLIKVIKTTKCKDKNMNLELITLFLLLKESGK